MQRIDVRQSSGEPSSKAVEINRTDTWVTINNIFLTVSDKWRIEKNEWFDDNIINVCQYLISICFPLFSGLIDTLLLSQFVQATECEKIIQIHHVSNHWVVSNRNGTSVTVYDSLKPTKMQDTLKKQLVKLYRLMFSGDYMVLKLDHICCQKQEGGSDCGAFAIANAVALASGFDFKHD